MKLPALSVVTTIGLSLSIWIVKTLLSVAPVSFAFHCSLLGMGLMVIIPLPLAGSSTFINLIFWGGVTCGVASGRDWSVNLLFWLETTRKQTTAPAIMSIITIN